MYEDLIDRLIVFFTAEKFQDEVAAAKREFFDESGIVDEDHPHFEMRMTQFLEWYLFSRRMNDTGKTPAEYALEIPDFEMTSDERPAFENLVGVRHSLFEFLKIRGNDVYVRDLWLGKKIVIPDSPVNIGFNRDEIFDARVIPDGDVFRFTRAFCFHPPEASRYILSEIKRIRKLENPAEEEAFMLKLLKMRYRYEQYRHLRLDYIYTNEKRTKF